MTLFEKKTLHICNQILGRDFLPIPELLGFLRIPKNTKVNQKCGMNQKFQTHN